MLSHSEWFWWHQLGSHLLSLLRENGLLVFRSKEDAELTKLYFCSFMDGTPVEVCDLDQGISFLKDGIVDDPFAEKHKSANLETLRRIRDEMRMDGPVGRRINVYTAEQLQIENPVYFQHNFEQWQIDILLEIASDKEHRYKDTPLGASTYIKAMNAEGALFTEFGQKLSGYSTKPG